MSIYPASGIMNPASSLPPIKGFLDTSLIDWPGCVCAVVFLPYCNLRCPYCHNHQLVLKPDTLETFSLDSVLKRVTSQGEWIDGICVTGGEPTIHRGLSALLEKIHEASLKVKLDTNGTQPEILQHLISHKLVDHVAMDVKAPLDDTAYARNAGVFVPTGLIKDPSRESCGPGFPTRSAARWHQHCFQRLTSMTWPKGSKTLHWNAMSPHLHPSSFRTSTRPIPWSLPTKTSNPMMRRLSIVYKPRSTKS